MKDTVTVVNKSASRVVYKLPELNIRRTLMPHEIRSDISVKELEALSQQPGGRKMLLHYLQVKDKEVIAHLLNTSPEPEYWIDDKDLPNWMNNSSLAEFQDALDFAPQGTKDLIKKYAVDMELNDYSKREAIKTQLGFDVSGAIEMNKASKTEDTAPIKPAARRVNASTEQAVRRVVNLEGENKGE